MDSAVALPARLLDPQHFVTLYGTTPPRADAPHEKIMLSATRLAERVRPLTLDGLVVYDVQDEADRTSEPRPFPFLPTIDSRYYARLLQQLTERQTLTYKCVVAMTEPSWQEWLSETRESYGLSCLSLVGSATPNPPPDALMVDQALKLAVAHPGDFTLGGVLIAERHSPTFNESRRLIQKAAQGCQFFVSQVVYSPDATVNVLGDYIEECRQSGVSPKRIVLTFSPCGRTKTMEFMKWLGVAIRPETERAILDDPAPFKRSIQICCDNLRAILDKGYGAALPLGVNIESVSIHKDEIEASIELVHALQEVAGEFGLS